MFDVFFDRVKGFFPNLIWFFIAGCSTSLVWQAIDGMGVDPSAVLTTGLTAVLAAFMASLVISAVENGS